MAKKVIVFSTKVCPWCFKVKDFLNEHKIAFEEKDVSEDKTALAEMLEASNQMGVPQIWVGSGSSKKVIVGYDANSLKTALNIK